MFHVPLVPATPCGFTAPNPEMLESMFTTSLLSCLICNGEDLGIVVTLIMFARLIITYPSTAKQTQCRSWSERTYHSFRTAASMVTAIGFVSDILQMHAL